MLHQNKILVLIDAIDVKRDQEAHAGLCKIS